MKKENAENSTTAGTSPERRLRERTSFTTPIRVNFKLEYEGEIVDISKEGLAIKFHPIGTKSLNVGNHLRIQVDMQDRIVSLQGEIKRISEKFGHLILGMEYDRDDIALFKFMPGKEEKPSES
ncbi:PilZ domain-containing protein [bacterium]|nr:PilZ domain-containing protein [candidate division CSSED10-310 bacterium]